MNFRIKVLMVFIPLCFLLCFMSNTYSRYVANTTCDLKMSFAQWQLLINNEDIKKFELELHELINYLKIHVIKDKITLIYLNRIGNTIRYGKYNYGVKTDYNTIKINKSYDLKYVYQIIKKEFSSIFTQEQKYTFFSGYNLLINLGQLS